LVILAFLLLWFLSELGSPAAITFLIGASVSLVAGIVGIVASMRLSSKISYSSKFGLAPSFRTAYQSASVIAFSTVSLHLLGNITFIQLSQSQPTFSNKIFHFQTPAPNINTIASYSKVLQVMDLEHH
jgi:Na+/H+-translocating membrane pyrophosphatase